VVDGGIMFAPSLISTEDTNTSELLLPDLMINTKRSNHRVILPFKSMTGE